VSLCKAWRGLRAEELRKITNFKDIEFVHHGGFIGGAWSLESCIKMAELSIQEHNEAVKAADLAKAASTGEQAQPTEEKAKTD